MLRILALEPYYGGSHKAFLQGWVERSAHRWTLLTLPAHNWKWRMRHAAVTFAEQTAERVELEQRWDLLFCSDMLSLAEFVGLAPEPVRRLPRVAYFHENQLTYPVREDRERDLHFAFTNLSTALTADQTWFNSRFHREAFVLALNDLLARMPDHAPKDAVTVIQKHGRIMPPGIEPFPERKQRAPGPLRILWAARWEHDKNPETFFDAIYEFKKRKGEFRLSVIGQSFEQAPDVFEEAETLLADHIDHWGFQNSREDYRTVLQHADVVVSTAIHEFFGIGVAEAVAAGAYPLVPERLAYPELLGLSENILHKQFFYNGSSDELVFRLMDLSNRLGQDGTIWRGTPHHLQRFMQAHAWSERVPQYDRALQELVDTR